MTTSPIKPIETVYKGYRFRSRLEARWAVFFEQMKWPWEYEPEGYEWRDQKYLPDFVCRLIVPTYFEIKPLFSEEQKLSAKEAQSKWLDFAKHFVSPERSAVLIFGSPWVDMRAWVAAWDEERKGSSVVIDTFLGQCPCCDSPSLLIVGEDLKRKVWNAPGFNRRPYELARSARFEHGEKGAPR